MYKFSTQPMEMYPAVFFGQKKTGLEQEHDTLEISAKLTHPKGLLGVFQRFQLNFNVRLFKCQNLPDHLSC